MIVKTRNFACLFLMAMFVFAVSGCGGGHSDSFVDDYTPNTQSEDVTRTPTPAPTPTNPEAPATESADTLAPVVDVDDAATVSTILAGLNASSGTEVSVLPEEATGSERTVADLSDEDLAELPEGETPAAVLPIMRVSKAAVYVFGVALDSLKAGDAIYLHMMPESDTSAAEFAAADAEDGSYVFLDDSGKTVTTVPANKHINVAAYMTPGKSYAPVITTASTAPVAPVVSPDTPSPSPTPVPVPVPAPTSPDVQPVAPVVSPDRPAPSPTPASPDVQPAPPSSGDVPPSRPDSGDVPPTQPSNPDSGDVTPTTDSEDVTPTTDSEDVSGETYTSSTALENALLIDGKTATYENITVTKTGDASGQSEAYDWYGTNAAVLAKGGANVTITGATISSSAVGGNAVFSYGGNSGHNTSGSGDGTKITISNSTITTTSRNSGGIMVTGGGNLEASNLTITTQSGSSAAIRSDNGGGTMIVTGGTYTANGQGSPAIYSTANITGNDVTLVSGIAQVVVIEGGNSVTLDNATLTANHTSLNGQDTTYQAVLIYQSMSGDASDGASSFTMTGGSLTNTKGDIFHVTNATTTITLSDSISIVNNDSSGYFLRASADSWGNTGSNGGKVTLIADGQTINGNMLVDSISTLALNMKNSSEFNGAINTSGQNGTVSVTLDATSTWTLTGNSYVTSLTNNGTINTGSYTLYVNGTAYTK